MLIKRRKSSNIIEHSKEINKLSLNLIENEIHEKNIENLVNEIKETENRIKKEINEKKFRKKATPRISMLRIKLTPINIQTIQYILSSRIKNQNMLTVLNTLLSNMKFVSIATDLHDRERLIRSLSNCLKLEKRQKGSILFRYGNKGTRFYIVLGGEISVLTLKETVIELSFLNYIKYLFYLKIIKEDELAKKIAATNQYNDFGLTERYLDKYYDDILSFINKYYILTSINEYEVKKFTSVKTIIKLDSGFKNLSENTNNIQKDNDRDKVKFINNQYKSNIKNIRTFRRQSTIDVSRIKSIISNKLNILTIKNNEPEEKNEDKNKNPDSLINMDEKNSNERSQMNDLFEKQSEKKPTLKYKMISKIPNYLELDIDFFGPHDISNLVNYVIYNLEIYSQKSSKVSTIDEYIKQCSIDDNLKICDKNVKKDKITIFQYFEITKKVEGDIFGELALQHADSKRTATLITTKDSVFGYLSKNDYNLCLREIEMRKRKIDIYFIMSFSIFEEENWLNFERQYFNYFRKEHLVSGQVMINQNEKLENIYFIKEGQFEVSTKLSYVGISQILKQKNKKIQIQENDMNKSLEKENKNNNENIDNLEENIINNEYRNKTVYNNKEDNAKNSKKYMFLSENYIKQIKEVKTYRLCIVDNKDILGLNDICLADKTSFIKATCLSSEAIVFSIKINILEQLRKKNRKIEKNVKNIIQKREIIMIERLKSTTNKIFVDAKQNKKENISKLKKSENIETKRNQRLMSALATQYSDNIGAQYENKFYINKNESPKRNLIKSSLDKSGTYLNKKSKQKINMKTENKKYNLFDVKALIDKSIKNEKKTGFQKFMESVTERVEQINNRVNYSKYSRLFCPIYKKNSRLDSEKKEKRKINLKLDSLNMKTKISKNVNNDINSRKISNNIKLENPNNKSNDINRLEHVFIKNKENQILSNQYLNNIFSTENQNQTRKNILSKFENRTIYRNNTEQIKNRKNSKKIHKDYIKRILGARYKEHELPNGHKTFSKLMIPCIENSHNSRNKKSKKKTIEANKDSKVDLLFYDQLTKKNKGYYLKDIILQNQIKQRILSRNKIKQYKTISIEKNKSNKVYY